MPGKAPGCPGLRRGHELPDALGLLGREGEGGVRPTRVDQHGDLAGVALGRAGAAGGAGRQGQSQEHGAGAPFPSVRRARNREFRYGCLS